MINPSRVARQSVAGMVLAAAALAWVPPAYATPVRYVDLVLRGKNLTLALYTPKGPPIGTIFMGSGDVGWVGLGVSMSEFLSDQGYVVVGINVRQYLAAFTDGKNHLAVEDPPADYRVIRDWLTGERLLVRPVIVSGLSEGAAIAVLVAADDANHAWVDGLVTMGIPPVAEIAWRWKDFGSWITKGDANEPSFAPCDFAGRVAPVPFALIQSSHDDYVSPDEFQKCVAGAREPKRPLLIDAKNHRFTDRQPELQAAYLAALEWVAHARAQIP